MSKQQDLVLFFMMFFVVIAIRLRARYGIRDRFYDGALFVATPMLFGLAYSWVALNQAKSRRREVAAVPIGLTY
jgi:hypothetical protein